MENKNTHPQPDEKVLIAQAQQGDKQALSTLYELYVDAIYRFMFYRTGDAMIAEDLTAEVFTSVITALSHYRDRGLPFQAWLFRIARARLADYWRKTKRREKYHHEITNPDTELPEPKEEHTTIDFFEYEALQTALQYLTSAETEVVILRFAGGLNHREIAQVIHSNTNAVKSKMRRALRKLRKILEAQKDN